MSFYDVTDKYIEVLKPIVTSKGVHLILVEEILQPELNDQLRYQIVSELFGEWLKDKVGVVQLINKSK
jgi:parvulin-like peptidyl-prolyl isomerase